MISFHLAEWSKIYSQSSSSLNFYFELVYTNFSLARDWLCADGVSTPERLLLIRRRCKGCLLENLPHIPDICYVSQGLTGLVSLERDLSKKQRLQLHGSSSKEYLSFLQASVVGCKSGLLPLYFLQPFLQCVSLGLIPKTCLPTQ